MGVSACKCSFVRFEGKGEWETGIAVTTVFGLSSVIAIVPDDATTPIDIPNEVWDYRLDWTHSIDGDAKE